MDSTQSTNAAALNAPRSPASRVDRDRSSAWLLLGIILALPCAQAETSNESRAPQRVGVIYVVHGAPVHLRLSDSWDAGVQIASYDENSPVYRDMVWNPDQWANLLGLQNPQGGSPPAAMTFYRRNAFMMQRLGGTDPATGTTVAQAERLGQLLAERGRSRGLDIITDWASWIAGTTEVRHLPYPRFVYNRAGSAPTAVTYCGSQADGGIPPDYRWPDCEPRRYDVDGPVERLLKAGAEVLLLVDTTVGGVRFSKTRDVLQMARLARDDALRGTDGPVPPIIWVNDPTSLMDESYPTAPHGWTRSLGPPTADRAVPLAGRGNPVTDDPAYAGIVAEGILNAFSAEVLPADTGVLLFNHGIYPGDEVFDPKIDDTVVLMENLRQVLVDRAPGLNPQHILGGWMGVQEAGTQFSERTRVMRGEDIGHAFLYETDQQMPAAPWGFRYWDALEILRDAGVRHIVVAFPQIIVSATPSLVDFPNQVAKEIGYRNFHPFNDVSEPRWPGYGNPFAERWPAASPRLCRTDGPEPGIRLCCYQMGGCGPGLPYPESRQSPTDRPIHPLDPALAFDIPAFGHLGYRPELGPPDDSRPVQDQYRGTWSLWQPMDDEPKLADYLAEKVLEAIPTP